MNKELFSKLGELGLQKQSYLSTPPIADNNPVISYLICYRGYRDISGLFNYFESFMRVVAPENWNKMEFLLKLDLDDEKALNSIIVDKVLQKKYPKLSIRPFVYRAWEGRHTLNLHFMFLFSRRNLKSKFIGFGTDDSVCHTDVIPELEKHSKNNYIIFSNKKHAPVDMNPLKNYRTNVKWAGPTLTTPFPTISVKIIEITGNIGWGINLDNWIALINLILYSKYNVDLMKPLDNVRLWTAGKATNELGFPGYFNIEMLVSVNNLPSNSYYFDLAEQQARNIYLNMKEDGIRVK